MTRSSDAPRTNRLRSRRAMLQLATAGAAWIASPSLATAEPITAMAPSAAPSREGVIPFANTWKAVRQSQIVYSGSAVSRSLALNSLGLASRGFVTRGSSAQAMFSVDTAHRFRWITVRGTQEFPDALNDLRVGLSTPSWSTRSRVHTGFLETANALWDDVRSQAEQARANGETLILTGHSLGGAAAQILGHRLVGSGIPVHSVLTFGAPRVGDVVWADNYQSRMASRTHRFANGDDVVPCLPANSNRFQPSTNKSYRMTGGGWSVVNGDYCVRLPSVADLDPTRVTAKIKAKTCNRIGKAGNIVIGILVGPTPCFNPPAIVIEGSINTALAAATGSTSDHRIQSYVDRVQPTNVGSSSAAATVTVRPVSAP